MYFFIYVVRMFARCLNYIRKYLLFLQQGHCMKSKADIILTIFEDKLTEIYKTNKVRQSQVQMALDIAEFLDTNKKMMIIQAPVGTGKSLAALVPTLVD